MGKKFGTLVGNWGRSSGSLELSSPVGYLYLIGVEFRQQVIGAIVNMPNLKQRTLKGSMGLFEGIGMSVWRFP